MDADSSAEIVEDFKEALLDLKVNSKPEIDVLTVIAKENTTHAEAISDVLEEHIKTVGRQRAVEWR
jgi:pre-mRNA cleavage complex 2 protein Pcf11